MFVKVIARRAESGTLLSGQMLPEKRPQRGPALLILRHHVDQQREVGPRGAVQVAGRPFQRGVIDDVRTATGDIAHPVQDLGPRLGVVLVEGLERRMLPLAQVGDQLFVAHGRAQ